MRLTWTALLAAGLTATPALAADHADAPGAAADPLADIADFFAFHTEDGKLVAILTFQPLMAPGAAASWDADLLYGIHIDTDMDAVADKDVWVRFGQDAEGAWGMHVDGLPGTSAPLVGAVDTALEADGLRAWAGVKDDPFFFDMQGLNDTLATGTLSFTATDALAGLNVQAIVLEMDQAAAADGADTVSLWATTHRK